MPSELILGPIVAVDESTARIWFKDEPNRGLEVKYAEPFQQARTLSITCEADGICVCGIKDLRPNTEYEYGIFPANTPQSLAIGRFATFPDSHISIDFSFCFFSCHKPELNGAMAMWDRLSGLCHNASRLSPDSLRFALAIGDQIYADELGLNPKQYLNMDEESLAIHFDSRYNDFWRLRSLRDVFSRCPVYMTWDDHEIRDGWASRKKDRSNPQLKRVYSAAANAYVRHQLAHNPFCPRPETIKYYSFRFAQAGFIVTDLRGERDATSGAVMSRAQWEWLLQVLYSYSSQCQVVFLILGVPLYHPVRGLAKAVVDIKNIFSKDEMEDSWSAKQWQAEGLRLTKLLFDVQGAPGQRGRIVLLSGDAHIATCAEIRMGTDRQSLVIPQFTSSAISNAAPAVLKKVKGNIQDKSWRPLYSRMVYEARIPHLVAARNFGVVRVTRVDDDKSSVSFDLQHEKSDAHVTMFDGKIIEKSIVVS